MRWFFRKKQPESLSPLEGYNRWAASYASESNPIKDRSDELVERFLPTLTGLSLLDYGCGTGKFCKLAESQNASKIVGIDLSPAMIKEAKKHTSRTEYLSGDIAALSLANGDFDVILSALVLGHIENLEGCLNNLLPKLKSGGIFIATDFHPFLTLRNSKRTFLDKKSGQQFEVKHHLHLFEDYLRLLKQNDFDIESLEEPKFNGMPVVFGIKAIKR